MRVNDGFLAFSFQDFGLFLSLDEEGSISEENYQAILSRDYSTGIPQIEFEFLDENICSPIEKFKRYLDSHNSYRR